MTTTDIPESETMRLFRSLSNSSSVTSAENRAYAWLLNRHWRELSESLKADGSRVAGRPTGQSLDAEFVAGAQLAVHWTGDPRTLRRLVFVAHADTEGYVFDRVVNPAQMRIGGRHPNPWRHILPDFRRNKPVNIVVGRGTQIKSFVGIIEQVNRSPGVLTEENGAITVSLAATDDDVRRTIFSAIEEPFGTVTAVHSFKISVTEDGIFAPYVDNSAGVAVSTAVLSDLVRRRSAVNASILYTSGEEAGFTGVLELLSNYRLGFGGNADDIAWVVVDCSDYTKSYRSGIDQWRAARRGAPPYKHKQLCPDSMTAVRLGDAASDFDISVSRMLYQAAIEARADVRRDVLETAKQTAAERALRDGVETQISLMGISGVFAGGLCEASMLSHAAELGTLLGRETPPVRVGSVAIPLSNFQAIDPLMAEIGAHHQPERTHHGALNSAYYILRAAAKLHMDYSYPAAIRREDWGFRSRSEDGSTQTREMFLKEFVDLTKARNVDTTAANKRWITDEGNDLVSRIQVALF